jgi:hypothetical protein
VITRPEVLPRCQPEPSVRGIAPRLPACHGPDACILQGLLWSAVEEAARGSRRRAKGPRRKLNDRLMPQRSPKRSRVRYVSRSHCGGPTCRPHVSGYCRPKSFLPATGICAVNTSPESDSVM